MNTIYGKTFTTREDLENVESWNLGGKDRFNIPAGTVIQVMRVYDTFHTTVALIDEAGKAIPHELNRRAYRFIVNNIALSDAIDAYVPTRTHDPIGELIALES